MLITAIISSLLMIFMGYEAFTNPYFGVVENGAPFWPGIAYIASLVGLSVIIYGVSKWNNLKKGINIDLNYKEIPPE
jgi:hypothetical protein